MENESKFNKKYPEQKGLVSFSNHASQRLEQRFGNDITPEYGKAILSAIKELKREPLKNSTRGLSNNTTVVLSRKKKNGKHVVISGWHD